ncbi:MAG: hypothetical protein [Microvirus sp.]|nr:MAG: hypothetical protein [Microvirus sp.]
MSKSTNVVQMTRSTIKSKFDFVGYKAVWTTNQKSLTVPNRTLTLRQISERFAAGLTTNDEHVALYDEINPVIKGFNKLDITERMEIVQQAEAQMRAKLHARQLELRTKQTQKLNDFIQDKVDKLLEEKKQTILDGQNKPAA